MAPNLAGVARLCAPVATVRLSVVHTRRCNSGVAGQVRSQVDVTRRKVRAPISVYFMISVWLCEVVYDIVVHIDSPLRQSIGVRES